MRFAYADPPFIGTAEHYKDQPTYGGEVDHAALLGRLHDEFPDGWALSASAPSLWQLLPMIPVDWGCRIGVFCKTWVPYHPGVSPAYAWEAVIFRGGRPRPRLKGTVKDWVACRAQVKSGLCGSKPDEFSYWLFELLHMLPEDELVELFPGTGRVTRAWQVWCKAKMALFA